MHRSPSRLMEASNRPQQQASASRTKGERWTTVYTTTMPSTTGPWTATMEAVETVMGEGEGKQKTMITGVDLATYTPAAR